MDLGFFLEKGKLEMVFFNEEPLTRGLPMRPRRRVKWRSNNIAIGTRDTSLVAWHRAKGVR